MTFKSHRYFRQTFFSLFLRLYLIFLDEIEYRLSRAQFGFNKENSVSREAGHGKARWRVLVPARFVLCVSFSPPLFLLRPCAPTAGTWNRVYARTGSELGSVVVSWRVERNMT